MKSDGARTENLCIQKFQTCRVEVFKDPPSSSKGERIYDEAHLIDKTVLQHRLRQLTHTILQKGATWLCLQLANLFGDLALHERCIPGERVLQAPRSNILGHTVYLVRVFPVASRPNL